MSEEKSIREVRLDKLQRMRELGHDPYKVERFDKQFSSHELLERFDDLQEREISFAGRVVSMRLMGKAAFAHLSDGDARIQGYFKKDILGEEGWELFNLLDIGDHVGVVGKLFVTKTGEKSIEVHRLTPLSKALHNLPIGKEKEGQSWYGLTDPDLRYRHRHLDLIANPNERKMLLDRMKIVAATRRFFDSQGFLEVETPILQVIAGGAAARPFVTHFNAYEMEVKLRISLELYLKRLICGDIPRVYEIGRVFRNEGVSNRHNPEFSLLEFYAAYMDMNDVMEVVENLFRTVSQEVFGGTQVTVQGVTIDFAQPWRRVNLLEAIEAHSGVKQEELQDLETAKRAMERVGLPTEKENNLGGIIEKLLERFVEPTLVQPAFVVGYPIETSPLAKKDPNNPRMTRRFEGYIRGREICNAFSEINDPIDQLERFEQQQRELTKGDEEAHPMDEEYIFALESGMPPTGGCGIGMDRMAMVLTGSEQIREIVLFPTMKPVSFSVPNLDDSVETNP